ncbi:MAG TPA: NAD(P)-binding protein [Gemmatimonadales bacterium]|nr:NAD(P)-binding protein [Gemmatimonadales bacterium]
MPRRPSRPTPPRRDQSLSPEDRALGMDRDIPRRDFLNGVAIAVGASLLPRGLFGARESAAQFGAGAPYPPALTGLRGSHLGSFEVMHRVKDGRLDDFLRAARRTDESYDLVVVGGGISGLAAAHFFQEQQGANARILILDNHDDFGGHAKRNEFRVNGRLLVGYGGSQSIENPGRYSSVARALLSDLGIDTGVFYHAFDRTFYRSRGLSGALFLDRETFGTDRLLPGMGRESWSSPNVEAVLRQAPLPAEAREALSRVFREQGDPLRGMDIEAKKIWLAHTSYRQYLIEKFQAPEEALRVLQPLTHDLYGVGIEAVPALDCWGLGFPGMSGIDLGPGPYPGIGLTPAPHPEEPYIFHFPDGNASIARLLVRKLIPDAVPGATMKDVVTSRIDYGRLDRPGARCRIRLNSTAIQVRHQGSPSDSRGVEVTYVQGGRTRVIQAGGAVLACWNSVAPYICPELPKVQREALRYGVKVPLVYTNVALRTWQAFERLKIHGFYSPGCYFSNGSLDFPVSLGDYRFSRGPEEPIVLHLLRTPCRPGLPSREQHRAGHVELLETSFETFERRLRDQLARILGAGGFDPARDIAAITVNRWPHGYAYEYNSLWDPLWKPGEAPCEIGRRPLGRITVANSDAGAYAYANSAIDQAYRAVSELKAAPPS